MINLPLCSRSFRALLQGSCSPCKGLFRVSYLHVGCTNKRFHGRDLSMARCDVHERYLLTTSDAALSRQYFWLRMMRAGAIHHCSVRSPTGSQAVPGYLAVRRPALSGSASRTACPVAKGVS